MTDELEQARQIAVNHICGKNAQCSTDDERCSCTDIAREILALGKPCKFGGGNDYLACSVCGIEYDYRTQERPPCGAPAEIARLRECANRAEIEVGRLKPIVWAVARGDFDQAMTQAVATDILADIASDQRKAIYIASKTKHAARWRELRSNGLPINSTWIDEAGEGESKDLADLWRRCISEASSASALLIYREPGEILKGAWIEMGVALAAGVPVYAVGIEEYTIANAAGVTHFADIESALADIAKEERTGEDEGEYIARKDRERQRAKRDREVRDHD